MSWIEPTHNPNGITHFFLHKLGGRQKTIFMIGITQVNVRDSKQITYLNLESNLNTFSNLTFVEALNIHLLNE